MFNSTSAIDKLDIALDIFIMASKGSLLCLTIYSYKKDGMSDEDYRQYMLRTHAPLASTLMEKYGIVGFNMVQKPRDLYSRSPAKMSGL